MNANFFLKSFRILLFPFAVLYGIVVKCRNWLYNRGYKKSVVFNLPIINVGNLAVGGTGKSPMVAYLVMQLQQQYTIAILSRGYRRKTKGYVLASQNSTALEIGDEPLMYSQQFKNVAVAVGEQRILAVPQLLHDVPTTQLIILDDALQHRAITATYNIVLTDYSNLYIHDFFVPTGDLRDERKSITRANTVIVTKCPANLSIAESTAIANKLQLPSHIPLYFTTIIYGSLYNIHTNATTNLDVTMQVLLVTGIANPQPIEALLEQQVQLYEKIQYPDHHIFDIDDVKEINKQFEALKCDHKIILTTQKDAMRLQKFGTAIAHLPIYILPITIEFLFNANTIFMANVEAAIMLQKK